MARGLAEYDRKRDFRKTSEPAGGKRAAAQTKRKKAAGGSRKRTRDRFVIHEHHARRLHWDLRLERDGVLVSWAVPNGIPQDDKENRLAVHVEDHPLDYIDFKGEIPAGQYGAGLVKIWDHGTYDCEKFRDDEVMVVFHGKRLKGKYVLFQTRDDQWMVHRMDPPERPRDAMPEQVAPMLPTNRREPPSGDEWAFEIAWGGARVLYRWQPGRLHVLGADGEELAGKFPELRALGRELGSLEAILDGEIVVFGEDGRPDAELLARRLELDSDARIRRLADATPAALVLFDLLFVDGSDVTGLPYEERRQLLTDMKLRSECWQTPVNHVGDGGALAAAAAEQGLAGIVAKRLGSDYRPGKRSKDWLLVKTRRNTPRRAD